MSTSSIIPPAEASAHRAAVLELAHRAGRCTRHVERTSLHVEQCTHTFPSGTVAAWDPAGRWGDVHLPLGLLELTDSLSATRAAQLGGDLVAAADLLRTLGVVSS